MRQEQLIVKAIFPHINIRPQYLQHLLHPFLLDPIPPKQLNNPLQGNKPIIIPRNQPKGISDVPQIKLRVADLEGFHELFKVHFIINVEYFFAEFGEVLGGDVIPNALEDVL